MKDTSIAGQLGPRVKPITLIRLMQHESVRTTIKFHVELDAGVNGTPYTTIGRCWRFSDVCWMARLARVVVPGMPHHVTRWGNRRQETFFCDDDDQTCLDLMAPVVRGT